MQGQWKLHMKESIRVYDIHCKPKSCKFKLLGKLVIQQYSKSSTKHGKTFCISQNRASIRSNTFLTSILNSFSSHELWLTKVAKRYASLLELEKKFWLFISQSKQCLYIRKTERKNECPKRSCKIIHHKLNVACYIASP